ncbi:hypothetical protein [Mucilaginibacter sp.]|uniref:hypothetical protein n=1 Tax=Mucilaginibacter sp. TaxID=1882438 RepID=UPI002626B6F8|nr:hypothetical protein [Mucilaginibacter sp.]
MSSQTTYVLAVCEDTYSRGYHFLDNAVAYTLSAGYLLFPKVYQNYNQVNVNLYTELLGKTIPDMGKAILMPRPVSSLYLIVLVKG